MDDAMTYSEAAEGIRAAIARYTHALDDGRTDDVVAYCPDGTFEAPGVGRFEGHDALREAYAGWAPKRPQRHLVVNTLVDEWSAQEATATSDVVFILEGKAGWGVQFVARYRDVLHHVDGAWKFHSRTVS
jgi:ketosteroid isomerase-like protein